MSMFYLRLSEGSTPEAPLSVLLLRKTLGNTEERKEHLLFVPRSPMLFPSLCKPSPETKSLTGGNAKKSCSHSEEVRQANLWGKILKELNTHSLAQQPGEELGGAFHSQETSGMSQHWGQQWERGKKLVPSFWEELTGILSLVNWPKVLYAFLSLDSCNSVIQLTTVPLGESQVEYDSMETHQEFPSIILINQYVFNCFSNYKRI